MQMCIRDRAKHPVPPMPSPVEVNPDTTPMPEAWGRPKSLEELIKWGVDFDKNEKGEFDLHREGGHSEFRILHHKDNTGAEIQDMKYSMRHHLNF